MPKSATKVPKKGLVGIRWSLAQAHTEFDVDRGFLAKNLVKEGISASQEDGMFSTAQICAAIYGDIDRHRARKLDAEADGAEMDNELRRKQAASLPAIVRFLGRVMTLVAARVRASSTMEEDSKRELLTELSALYDDHVVTKALFGGEEEEDDKV